MLGTAFDTATRAVTNVAKPQSKRYEKVKNPYTGKIERIELKGATLSKEELDGVFRLWDEENGNAPFVPAGLSGEPEPKPEDSGMVGKALGMAVRGERPPRRTTAEITSFDPKRHGQPQTPAQRQTTEQKLEADYLFNLSNEKLDDLIEGTYDNKRPAGVSGRSLPEIREKLLTERQRRLGQVGESALPPVIRQIAAFGLNLPQQIRSSAANIQDPESSVGDVLMGAADIVPIPIAGELVNLGLKGLGKLGGKIANSLKGQKFASKADVETFLSKQGLSRDQVTMVMRTADGKSVATAPKIDAPLGAKVGAGIRDSVPKVLSPNQPKPPRSSQVLGGPNDVLNERIGREAANIRAANPGMPEEEVNRLATIYAKKKLESVPPNAPKVQPGATTSKPSAPKADVPTEARTAPKTPEDIEGVSGIRMQDLEDASRKLGITLPDKANFKEHWSEVEARALGEFDRIAKNIEKADISKNPALSRDEHYVGNVELRRLGGEISDLSEKLGKATSKADKEALQIQLDDRLNQAERLSKLLYRSNSEFGRNLAFLRFTLDGPFDVAGLTAKAERLAGGNLNSKVRLTLTNLAKKGEKATLTLEEKMRNEAEKALKSILEQKPKITARGVKRC